MISFNVLREQVEARQALPPPPMRRAIRQAAGVSLDDLAASLGVSREAVRMWEIGRHEPYPQNLSRYLKALGVLRESAR